MPCEEEGVDSADAEAHGHGSRKKVPKVGNAIPRRCHASPRATQRAHVHMDDPVDAVCRVPAKLLENGPVEHEEHHAAPRLADEDPDGRCGHEEQDKSECTRERENHPVWVGVDQFVKHDEEGRVDAREAGERVEDGHGRVRRMASGRLSETWKIGHGRNGRMEGEHDAEHLEMYAAIEAPSRSGAEEERWEQILRQKRRALERPSMDRRYMSNDDAQAAVVALSYWQLRVASLHDRVQRRLRTRADDAARNAQQELNQADVELDEAETTFMNVEGLEATLLATRGANDVIARVRSRVQHVASDLSIHATDTSLSPDLEALADMLLVGPSQELSADDPTNKRKAPAQFRLYTVANTGMPIYSRTGKGPGRAVFFPLRDDLVKDRSACFHWVRRLEVSTDECALLLADARTRHAKWLALSRAPTGDVEPVAPGSKQRESMSSVLASAATIAGAATQELSAQLRTLESTRRHARLAVIALDECIDTCDVYARSVEEGAGTRRTLPSAASPSEAPSSAGGRAEAAPSTILAIRAMRAADAARMQARGVLRVAQKEVARVRAQLEAKRSAVQLSAYWRRRQWLPHSAQRGGAGGGAEGGAVDPADLLPSVKERMASRENTGLDWERSSPTAGGGLEKQGQYSPAGKKSSSAEGVKGNGSAYPTGTAAVQRAMLSPTEARKGGADPRAFQAGIPYNQAMAEKLEIGSRGSPASSGPWPGGGGSPTSSQRAVIADALGAEALEQFEAECRQLAARLRSLPPGSRLGGALDEDRRRLQQHWQVLWRQAASQRAVS